MSKTNDAPAYPVTAGNQVYAIGITKREWFAAHAPEPPMTWWGSSGRTCAGYAMWNYQYADAMLAGNAEEVKP